DVLAEAKAERKNVVALEEERALFGKEQRKACQIRAARVDFRFREVGVHRSRDEDICAESLVEVEAGLKVALDVSAGCRNASARRDCRPDGQADAEIEIGQIREESGPAGLRDLVLSVRGCPPIGFEPPLNPSLDVEVPFVKPRLEGDRENWNPDLRAPAGGCS